MAALYSEAVFLFGAGLFLNRVVLIYDGDPHQDFISGLGIRFGVPLSGPLYNRHVRLAGDTGWFSESPKGLMLFRLQERQRKLYARASGRTLHLLRSGARQRTAGSPKRFSGMGRLPVVAALLRFLYDLEADEGRSVPGFALRWEPDPGG